MYDAASRPLEAVQDAHAARLPEGWREAERGELADPRLISERRRLVLRLGAIGLVLVAVLAVLVWVAASHYSRGVEALRAGAYSQAIGELSAARILVFPYRDAEALEDQARRGLQAEDAARRAWEARVGGVAAKLDRASARLAAGDVKGSVAALESIPRADLRATRTEREVAGARGELRTGLTDAATQALKQAKWDRAARLAGALLVLVPASTEAQSLAARAATGARLRDQLNEAREAARDGRWRTALRLALAVLAVRKEFPGAAAVVADAREALRPKPKPKPVPTQAPVVVTEPTTGGSTTTTPPQPPPP